MEVALKLILVRLIVKVLCQCLYVVNGGCIKVDTGPIDCDSAVPVLYVVNGGCIGVDTDGIDCETALPVCVRSESRLLQTRD